MQTQSNIGIFCRIVCCNLEIDLIKTNLVDAFAAHLFIANGFHAQMAFSQAVHIVGHVRLEHI